MITTENVRSSTKNVSARNELGLLGILRLDKSRDSVSLCILYHRTNYFGTSGTVMLIEIEFTVEPGENTKTKLFFTIKTAEIVPAVFFSSVYRV